MIKTLGADFVIVTGDIGQNPFVENYELYASLMATLTMPVYNIPGNHDETLGAWNNYQSVLGNVRFAFEFGPYKFIGIATREQADAHGAMPEEERDLLEAELLSAGELIPLVFGHHPIVDSFGSQWNVTDGQAETLALFATYNVVAYLSGHTHMAMQSVTQAGTVHVNGDALVPRINYPAGCGMMVCDVFADRIEIQYVRGTAPWDWLGPAKIVI